MCPRSVVVDGVVSVGIAVAVVVVVAVAVAVTGVVVFFMIQSNASKKDAMRIKTPDESCCRRDLERLFSRRATRRRCRNLCCPSVPTHSTLQIILHMRKTTATACATMR